MHEARSLVGVIAAALALSSLFRILLFEPFTIPSSSMQPGLLIGDYVVTSKFAYGYSRASVSWLSPADGDGAPGGRLWGRFARRGDVVVFRLPADPHQVWVKRVIGLPGDHVRLEKGRVFINGQPLAQNLEGRVEDMSEPGLVVRQVREILPEGVSYRTLDRGAGSPGDDRDQIIVPAGHYLVLGDNRDNSLDGRFPETGVGLLPQSHLVGRAEWIAASWKPGAGVFKPWTWFNLRWGRQMRTVQ